MVRVCGFYIKGLLESLTSNCIASFIGSMARRGNVGPTAERVRNLGLGAGSYSAGRLSYSPVRKRGGGTLQSGERTGGPGPSIQETPNVPPPGESAGPPGALPSPERMPWLRTGAAQAAIF